MPGQVLIGTETIAGYEALKIRTDQVTWWLAPALGCAELKIRTSHPAGDTVEQVAVAIFPGEPAPELFEIPPHYHEVAANQLLRR
jgi:hypothetical protein